MPKKYHFSISLVSNKYSKLDIVTLPLKEPGKLPLVLRLRLEIVRLLLLISGENLRRYNTGLERNTEDFGLSQPAATFSGHGWTDSRAPPFCI